MSFVDGIYSLMFIVALVGALLLGGWFALNYITPTQTELPKEPPPEEKKPEPEPTNKIDPGHGPYEPSVPVEPPKKEPVVDTFKPVLNLLDARFDPVNRMIQAGYRILPNSSPPPTKTFSIFYDVLYKGQKTAEFSEEEPITSAELSGLQQMSLVTVTGAPPDADPSDLTVSASIHFRENGTVNSGVVGVPITINVK